MPADVYALLEARRPAILERGTGLARDEVAVRES